MFNTFNQFLNESKSNLIPAENIENFKTLTVYRSEDIINMYKGKGVFGSGKYYSLNRLSSERLSKSKDSIKEYTLKNLKNIAVFNIDWNKDYESSMRDYNTLNRLWELEKSTKKSIDKLLKNEVNGLMIYTDSMQWGFDQIVIFPHSK